MEFLVYRSKYVAETITIPIDFYDLLPVGNVIVGTPTITVSVFSGEDTNPSNLLYLGVSVQNNTVVWQRFRLGLPGVIYFITYLVYDGTHYYEKGTYLAILPDVGNAVPSYLTYWFTSDLYPLQAQDSFKVTFSPKNGTWYVGQTWAQDTFKVNFSPQNGTFSSSQVFYTTKPEQFKVFFSIGNGTFVIGQLFYTTKPEQFKVSLAPLNGTFVQGQVFYTTRAETFKVSFSVLNGTFTHV